MSKPIAAEDLTEGRTILVEGTATFSRVASQYSGDELQQRIASQRQRGAKYPTTKPHTTIAITNAQVTPADPNSMSLEEQFVQERTFISKSGENQGKAGYSIDDASSFLPPVMQPDPENPGQYIQVKPLEGELAKGLPVTLVLNTYKSKNHEKRGIGLQQILCRESIRYYSNNATAEALKAYGITIAGPVVQQNAADAVAPDQSAQQPVNTVTDPNTGHPMPGPAAAPDDYLRQLATAGPTAQPAQVTQQPPVQDPHAAAPQAQPAAQPPVQQPAAAPVAQPADNEQYGGLTAEQYIAQLQQQVAAQPAQPPQAAPGQSPFDVDSNNVAPSPWD